jgi:hypothetical protein
VDSKIQRPCQGDKKKKQNHFFQPSGWLSFHLIVFVKLTLCPESAKWPAPLRSRPNDLTYNQMIVTGKNTNQ